MTATRMQPEDSTYWFVREAFGWSVVLQLLWLLPAPPAPEALRAFNSRLAEGVLARRLAPAVVPFARPRWERAAAGPDLVVDPDPIPVAAVEPWARRELDTVPLDPERGPAWRLRAVTRTDGGAALSLTTLHLVADGRSMVAAAVDALHGNPRDPLTRHRAPRSPFAADLADGVGQVAAAGRGILRAVRASGTRADSPQARVRAPAHQRAPRAEPAWAMVSVDVADWEAAAAAHGGTANTLFVAVLAGLLRTSGAARSGTPLVVGIPVSHRADGDERGNATAGVSVVLTDDPVPGGDLAGIRRLCKAAFTRLSAGQRPAHVHLTPLLTLLPTGVVVRAVSAGSAMPDAVASNLGDFPAELADVGGVTADAVAFRGTAQGVDPDLPYRFGDGVQSWLLRTGSTLSFSVAAFDERHIADSAALRGLLGAELGKWKVVHRLW
ncbi:hypothetical protein ACTD5D_25145 [Nocardia takedensis]|uniref:hypothetical protein n=1 Tax=Nocardia takedensis TaxID=259390 RepID=UPI00031D20F1|nr:hypothetical protein [Nocardia takedensis]